VNLGAHYSPPWIPGLREIRTQIEAHLRKLFGEPPPPSDKAPEAVVRHLRFLNEARGGGGRVVKPRLQLIAWRVNDDDAWVVEVKAEMRNRPEGWSFEPAVVFVGADGQQVPVGWQRLVAGPGCISTDGRIVVPGGGTGRLLRAQFSGITSPESHPIPARESAIDVALRALGTSTTGIES
jgi:hypothetical protein